MNVCDRRPAPKHSKSASGVLGEDVLIEAKLAAWTYDASELGQRTLLVRHAAEDQAGDTGIAGGVIERQLTGGVRLRKPLRPPR